jgi:hypothetical protein
MSLEKVIEPDHQNERMGCTDMLVEVVVEYILWFRFRFGYWVK